MASIPTLYLIGDSTVKNGSGRGDGGFVALRPMQWQNYVDHVAAVTQCKITADGLRNVRKLF